MKNSEKFCVTRFTGLGSKEVDVRKVCNMSQFVRGFTKNILLESGSSNDLNGNRRK